MSAGHERQTALVPAQPAALTKAGAKSLAARGRADLRLREEAEEWLKKGVEFYRQRQFDDAFRCFEVGIQLNPNHPEIQFMLGLSFDEGFVRPRNNATARAWYRKAAEQGLKEAQYNLGLLYYGWDDGPGLLQNYEQAAIWFRMAAEQGYEKAQWRLSFLLGLGLVVPQNHAEVRKAAEQGHADAQLNLGASYFYGEGVPQDYAEAAVWWRKAAEQGRVEAQYTLGVIYAAGDGVPQDYEQAAFWYRKAGEHGDANAKTALATMRKTDTKQDTLPTLSAWEKFKIAYDAKFGNGSSAPTPPPRPPTLSERQDPRLPNNEQESVLKGFDQAKGGLRPSVSDEVSGGDQPSMGAEPEKSAKPGTSEPLMSSPIENPQEPIKPEEDARLPILEAEIEREWRAHRKAFVRELEKQKFLHQAIKNTAIACVELLHQYEKRGHGADQAREAMYAYLIHPQGDRS